MKPVKIVNLARCSEKQRESLLARSELEIDSVFPQVQKIVANVCRGGDRALLDYTQRFDGVRLKSGQLRVSDVEFRRAYQSVDAATVKAIRAAAEAIRKFHAMQMPRSWVKQIAPGVKAGQIVRPIKSVGVYVPGGLARYPSSLLMAAVPAKVAGVKKIVVCTPPGKDGRIDASVLAAAKVAGVDAVFKVGGAQAIAAMAFGTETVPKVEKIVGPGNLYVLTAKQIVSSIVRIDFAAGPSEVLIVADESADAHFVASDLISQAEHDPNAAAVLVTTSKELATEVQKLLIEMVRQAPRREIVSRALIKYGRIVLTRDLDEAVKFANDYAPEHLELMVKPQHSLLKKVENAGSIFLGNFSPVAAGDLAVGPSHILPTGGAAKQSSGLSVLDFIKLPTVQELSREGLGRLVPVVVRLAELESLPGHARSVRERLKEV